MSTVVFVSQIKPEKGLVKVLNYKAYLSAKEKEDIIKELEISVPNLDEYEVAMHVEIELKQYDS